MKIVKILAVNDDADTCECCGKTGLKRVVWVRLEDGEVMALGTTCATKKHIGASESAIKYEVYKTIKEVEAAIVAELTPSYKNTDLAPLSDELEQYLDALYVVIRAELVKYPHVAVSVNVIAAQLVA